MERPMLVMPVEIVALARLGHHSNALDLDAVWDEEWQSNLMVAALARVKRQVSPRQLQVFDLYVLQDWPAREVARTLGIGIAQVYLAKHRVSAVISKEIKRLERPPGQYVRGTFNSNGGI